MIYHAELLTEIDAFLDKAGMTATIIDFPVPANDPGMRIVDERFVAPSEAYAEAWDKHLRAHKRFVDTPCIETMNAKITRFAEMLDHLRELDDPKRRRLIGIQRANCLAFMRARAAETDGGAA